MFHRARGRRTASPGLGERTEQIGERFAFIFANLFAKLFAGTSKVDRRSEKESCRGKPKVYAYLRICTCDKGTFECAHVYEAQKVFLSFLPSHPLDNPQVFKANANMTREERAVVVRNFFMNYTTSIIE